MKRLPLGNFLSYGLTALLLGSMLVSSTIFSTNLFPSYAAVPPVIVTTTSIIYGAGDTVRIKGSVATVEQDLTTVKLTFSPSGGTCTTINANLDDNGEFEDECDISGSADEGRYRIRASYNGDIAYTFFKVEDNEVDAVSVETNDDLYNLGERVRISGTIEHTVSTEDQVHITITGPDDVELDSFSSTLDVSDYSDNYDLAGDADEGRYTVEVEYNGDRGIAIFEVAKASSDSSSSTLTATLDKSSYLAGETINVAGKVSKIIVDQTVNIDIYNPDKTYGGASAFAEPATDLSFTAQLKLPANLPAMSGYEVKLNYNGQELVKTFAITGKIDLISLETNKESYNIGDEVTISGKIAPSQFVEGQKLVLQVYNPDGAPYRIDVVTPKTDGSYSYSMIVGGKLALSGKYNVKVSYNQKSVQTTFQLEGTSNSGTTYNIRLGEKNYAIEYQVTDGTLKSMFLKPQDRKLVISINAESSGTIKVVLPRNVIDSAGDNGTDTNYIVVASDLDGGQDSTPDVTEVETSNDSRTLLIEFPAGTDLIEIQGTTVVPEFGTIAALVMAVAIITLIAATARYNRFSLFRR